MKKIFLLSLIVLVSLVFLIGCVKKVSPEASAVEDNKGVIVTDENNEVVVDSSVKESSEEAAKTESSSVETKTEETKKEEAPAVTKPSSCVHGWKCISSTMKAYLNEDCTWKSKSTCKLGCVNNACIVGSVCASGFKCMDDKTKGFQNEDCSWDQTVLCELGCKNSKCTEPVNATVNATS